MSTDESKMALNAAVHKNNDSDNIKNEIEEIKALSLNIVEVIQIGRAQPLKELFEELKGNKHLSSIVETSCFVKIGHYESIFRLIAAPMIEQSNHEFMEDTIKECCDMFDVAFAICKSTRPFFMTHKDGFTAFDMLVSCGFHHAVGAVLRKFMNDQTVARLSEYKGDGLKQPKMTLLHRCITGNGSQEEKCQVLKTLIFYAPSVIDQWSYLNTEIKDRTMDTPEEVMRHHHATQKEKEKESVEEPPKEQQPPKSSLRDPDGTIQSFTPLQMAIRNGELEVCRTLLELGADPNAPDALTWTPIFHLFYRLTPNALEIGNLLFKFGANLMVIDNQMMDISKLISHEDIPSSLCHIDGKIASRALLFIKFWEVYKNMQHENAIEYARLSIEKDIQAIAEDPALGNFDNPRIYIQQTSVVTEDFIEKNHLEDITVPGYEIKSRRTGCVFPQISLDERHRMRTKYARITPIISTQTGTGIVILEPVDPNNFEIPTEVRVSFSTGFKANDVESFVNSFDKPFAELEGVTHVIRVADLCTHLGLLQKPDDTSEIQHKNLLVPEGTVRLNTLSKILKTNFWLPSENFRNDLDPRYSVDNVRLPETEFCYAIYHEGNKSSWISTCIPTPILEDDDIVITPVGIFDGIEDTDEVKMQEVLRQKALATARVRFQLILNFEFLTKEMAVAAAKNALARTQRMNFIISQAEQMMESESSTSKPADEDQVADAH